MSPTPPSTTSSSNGAVSPEGQFRVVRKRNRVPLSCGPCRHRKLKCNRAHPCENCVKRGDAHSCTYAQTNVRKKSSPSQAASNSPDDMQNRIDRLESLVLSLMTNGSQAEGPAAAMAAISGTSSSIGSAQNILDLDVDDEPVQEESDTEQVTKSFGIMKFDNNKSYYISDAHWASVLSEISEVRNYFTTHKKQYEEQAERLKTTRLPTDVPGSTLLFGAMKPTSRAEIMSSFPSKYTTDMLIARYFNCYDPATHFLHGPTFQAQYNKHWEDPSQTCIVWIGMLFAMMRLSMLSYYREGDEPPEFRGKSLDMAGTFRNLVALCLTLADYTKPYPYLIECLAFHLHGDFCQTKEADISVWVLVGVIVRLAMRMGYHRDSKAFPNITPFQGEMRRRVWAFVRQADLMFSCQVGLPSMIRIADSDTEFPRNLYDDDFDENCKELPPSRPPSEPTPLSYLITKSRLAHVLGKAIEQASSLQSTSYDKVMEMDSELRRARDVIPEHLLVRPIEECPLDPLVLIMSRFSVMSVYHKAQCLLHRKYLIRARENPRFTHSRRTCIDSAMELLRFQAMLHAETGPTGRLRSRQNRVTSLSSSDFLLAATIVCLDLYHAYQVPSGGQTSADAFAWGRERRDEMLAAVQRSKDIWDELQDETMEAFKAGGALGVMLGRLRSGVAEKTSAGPPALAFEPQDEKQSAAMTLGLLSSGMTPLSQGPSTFSETPLKMADPLLPNFGGFTPADSIPGASSVFSNMFGQMPDMQVNLDWDAWDNYIQGPTLDTSNPWWSPADMQQQQSPGPLSSTQLPGAQTSSPQERMRSLPRSNNMFPHSNGFENNGSTHSLRRAACRLLASPSSIPVRPRLSAVSNSRRFTVPHRTVQLSLQSRWNSDDAKVKGEGAAAGTVAESDKKVVIETATETGTETTAQAATGTTAGTPVEATTQTTTETVTEAAVTEVVTETPARATPETAAETVTKTATETATDITPATSAQTTHIDQIRNAAAEDKDGIDRKQQELADAIAMNVKKEKKYMIVKNQFTPKETIYIGNLFYDVTPEDLKEQMSKYGVVEEVNLIYDSRGISKGFGYVNFDSISSARRAIQGMHMRIFEGRRVVSYFAQSNLRRTAAPTNPSKTLYIGNMAFEMTDRDINGLFSDVVNLIDVRVSVDRRTGQPRGFAHAEFVDTESAQAAREILNLKAPYGRKLRVDFSTSNREAFPVVTPIGAAAHA
ncbi:hypothetical protein AOCH_001635 [Aspergillus ochraceoroseus]|uniref:C6 transcription factor n=2 Tax=Aspergillus ochraceoroseus TaxID=138278 RepID=A0A0F8W684_9EURO|nr:hypothetical protein AOCH_001635 [Aspergillus ochraceoroseus]